jgi:hypothetical protein
MAPRPLDDRARDALIPEPIVFDIGTDRSPRFASDQLPWRVTIDVRGGVIFGVDMKVNESAGTVAITAGGRTAFYQRSGVGLRGEWICNLRAEAPERCG